MITLEAFWKGRDVQYVKELTDEIRDAAVVTVAKANRLLSLSGFQSFDKVNSGWRPRSVNDATSNAAGNSRHIYGQAVDIADPDRYLAAWCIRNVDVLEEIGLWMENPQWTPTWVHLQTLPPKSGNRIYIPSIQAALAPPLPEQLV